MQEELVREAVGASAKDSTAVAVCRVVGERDELRRMLQTGGIHDAEVRAILHARDGQTTADAARECHREIMLAEGSHDWLLDGIADALGHRRGPMDRGMAVERVRKLFDEHRSYARLLDRIREVPGFNSIMAPEELFRRAFERCVDFVAMQEDRDLYQKRLESCRVDRDAYKAKFAKLVESVQELLNGADGARERLCAALEETTEEEIPF